MTVNYTDSDIVNGHLQVNTGTEDYTVNVGVQVIIDMAKGEKGTGFIDLGSGHDLINFSSTGHTVIDMGAGDDVFNQYKPGNAVVDITGGLGSDTFWLAGVQMNANYSFALQGSQLVSNDGADTFTGSVANAGRGTNWIVGTDTLSFHTGGVVNATNFGTYFNVTDTPRGDVITDKSGTDGFSITLVGVHLTAQQLIDQGAFHFT